ncbi:MBL fold metallo-hydrolase [Salinicoccus sp. HZC-1]|uniref:MBL fold metallo-hydrolase n=1 Tax=Salinicoccus sp. HZC-1 TaxID=3385497 RepID=UPI00398A780C
MIPLLTQISSHVHILPSDAERDRPNLGYIHGQNYSMLIDTGNSQAHLQMMLHEIEKAGFPAPKIALITHWHWDHTFAMHAFDGLTVAHRKTNQILGTLTQWEWTEEAMAERLRTGEECEFCDTHIKVEYDDTTKIKVVQADIAFNGSTAFNLGDVTVEVTPITNPHSDDGVVVYIKEDKVLFAGDADTGDFYTLDGGYDPDRFYHYINEVDKIDYETYIHGHLDPMTREAVRAFRKQIEDEEL